MWQVLARNSDRTIAAVLKAWTLSLTLRFNEVGTWTLALPREEAPTGWPHPGCGVYIMSNGVVRASGMVDSTAYAEEGGGEPGTWTLAGDTDLGRIAYSIVYPTPTAAWTAQTTTAYYTATGNAEVLMRGLVNTQAGPGALVARRASGVALGTLANVGTSTTVSERFTPLLDALRKTALAGGGLGFDVIGSTTGVLSFVVYQPADRTLTARFGVDLGNVLGLSVEQTAPTATVAQVAGGGTGTGRSTYEVIDAGADARWGRREAFVDQRQTTDTAEFTRAANEALDGGAEQVAVSAEIQDTPVTQWGRDYNLGDQVAILTPFGAISDIVRAVTVSVEESGEATVTSTIGTAEATSDDTQDRIVRGLLRRISHLERNV